MKKLISVIILAGLSFVTDAQSDTVKFDKRVKDFTISFYKNNNADVAFKGSDFNFTKIFFKNLKENNYELLGKKFMNRPDNNTMVANYILFELQMNVNSEQPEVESIVAEKALKKLSNNILVLHYYESIFENAFGTEFLYSKKETDLSKTNVDLNTLNLKDSTEKAIVFLAAIRYLSKKFDFYDLTSSKIEENIKYCETLPKFNGQDFYNYKVPKFINFAFAPKVSFKETYLFRYTDFLTHYMQTYETR